MMLTELERFDGLAILATNLPQNIDEAMHRRITLACEFKRPDHLMRAAIWQNLTPENLEVDVTDEDFSALAMKYELTGPSE